MADSTLPRDRAVPMDRQRYWRIIRFFASLLLHLIWWDILLGRIFRGRVRASRSERLRHWARRFRGLAAELGGVMIKLGQFLSSRVDVLPPEITDELAGLQDEVPPVPAEAIQQVLRNELGTLENHFVEFEFVPLAAASLGQAHRARLVGESEDEPGDAVVVKVQRPNIEQLVRTDLAALRLVARWAMRYRPIRRRANVPALLEEFARTLWEELDYEAEARNAERFAEMFAFDDRVYIPAVHPEHSTRRVLVLENVTGIKITDVAAMQAAAIDPKEVAERLLDVYFHQIFREGFFHADPHPGNLFVQPKSDSWQPDEPDPRPFYLIFVDFGMVGRIKEAMGDNLRRVLSSVTQRDARELTLAYRDMGFFLPGADLDRIAEAQAVALDQIWGRKLLDLARPDPREVQELSREFRDILFEFPFQVPQDFIYLGRAMGMLSGLVSLLDPDINPWYQVEKYGREIIRSSELREFSREALLELLRPFFTLPHQIERLVRLAESGQLRVEARPDRSTLRRLDRLERRIGRLSWSILAATLILSGTLLYLNGFVALATAAWTLAFLFFLIGVR